MTWSLRTVIKIHASGSSPVRSLSGVVQARYGATQKSDTRYRGYRGAFRACSAQQLPERALQADSDPPSIAKPCRRLYLLHSTLQVSDWRP